MTKVLPSYSTLTSPETPVYRSDLYGNLKTFRKVWFSPTTLEKDDPTPKKTRVRKVRLFLLTRKRIKGRWSKRKDLLLLHSLEIRNR